MDGLDVANVMSEGMFHIQSDKFPILPGEEEEVVNPRTHGKALAEYLSDKLKSRGYIVPSFFAEDFGWWIEINFQDLASNIVLRRAQDEPDGMADFAIATSTNDRMWSWRRFRFLDIADLNKRILRDVEAILMLDSDIRIIARNFDSYPDDRINRKMANKQADMATPSNLSD